MQTIDTHYDFGSPVQAVWRYLEDFGNIEAWWPKGGPVDIQKVVLEGDGVGMIRHIHNEGFGSPISERLDSIDPASHAYTLSIVGVPPAGIRTYEAEGQLSDLPDGGSRLTYHARFTAEPGREEEARLFLLGAYELMFGGLAQATARERR